MLLIFACGIYIAFEGFQLAWRELPQHPTKSDSEKIAVGWFGFIFGVFASSTSVVYGCYHWCKKKASRS
jgi:hypothetical protein